MQDSIFLALASASLLVLAPGCRTQLYELDSPVVDDMTTTAMGGGPDVGPGAADLMDTTLRRTMQISIVDLAEQPVAGVTIAVEEYPGTTGTSNAMGNLSLSLPIGKTLTMTATRQGYVKTVEQPLRVNASGMVPDWTFYLVTQSQFDTIQKAGGAPPGSALVGISISTPQNSKCSIIGVTLGLVPPKGKLVYVAGDATRSDKVDPAATAVANDMTLVQGYVTGVTGANLTPIGKSMDCAFATWPEDFGGLTALGPFNAEPGAFNDLSLDLM